MPSSAAVCPSCEFRAFISLFSPIRSWQTRRSMATAMSQRKRPARMSLSADVSRTGGDRKPSRRIEAGPFAGMNQREAPFLPRSAARQSAGQPQRSFRQDYKATLSKGKMTRSTTKPAVLTDSKKPKVDKNEKPMFHALKMQQTLTPMTYFQRDKLKQKVEAISHFEELGLMQPVLDAMYNQALPGLTDYAPTPVQKLAIPALLSKKGQYEKQKKAQGEDKYDQFLLAAETGSGKTLAYLLPVIDGVKRQEELDLAEQLERDAQEAKERASRPSEDMFKADPSETEEKPHPTMGRPRALILLPSSELVTQVGKVVKVMSHKIKYRSAPISASNTPTVIRNRLFNPRGIDILVATPHLVSSIAEKEPNILSRVQYLVVDEADSLLDRSFSATTCGIIDRAAPSLKQLILCSATIPNSLDKFLDRRFPQIKRLVTPKLHSITRRVQLGVVDIEKDPYRGNRDLACADIIWQLGRAVHDDTLKKHTIKCIMVFVNEREQAETLASFLAGKGIDAAALTRDTSEQRQSEILAAFTSSSRVEGEEKSGPDTKKKSFGDFIPFEAGQGENNSSARGTKRLPNTKVLVTTDLGSRGIDTLAVRHVILYDVPHTTIDFVHRLGRCGRMGRRGRGVVLVGKHDRKDVVREVQDAMFRGQALI